MPFRQVLAVIAVAFALITGAVALYYWSAQPRTVSIAAGVQNSETHRFAQALSKAANDAKSGIRFLPLASAGAEDSGRMLEAGRADLAIVRSDLELPTTGQAIIVNTKRTLILIVPARRGSATELVELKGKRIGVVRWTDANIPLLRKALAVAEIGENDAAVTQIEGREAADLLAQNKLDAVAIVAQLTAPILTEIMLQMGRKVPGGVNILSLDEAQAIANRVTGTETADIPAGALGAGRPAEESESIAVSYVTMARADMSEDLAGRVAKAIMDLKPRVARQMPQAFAATAPDADSSSGITVHPGAAAHFEGESKTLFERYNELVTAVFWVVSLVVSGLTAFVAWLRSKRKDAAAIALETIAALTAEARAADSRQALDAIELRGDALVAELSQDASDSDMTPTALQSIGLAMEQLRHAAGMTRRRLEA
jgi:TRAP transporter TAXI family solute receptor